MPIVLKENANGVYRISTYFIAKNIAEVSNNGYFKANLTDLSYPNTSFFRSFIT